MSLLRKTRQLRGITQADVANALGITAASLSRIERGLSTPRMPLMERIAQYYGLPLEEVEASFDRTTQQHNTAQPRTEPVIDKPTPSLSPIENALVETYRSGIAAGRQAVQSEIVHVPVIGETAAGYGYSAQMEHTGNTVTLPREILRDTPDTYFALTVRGQSMEPELRDGDTAVLHQQSTLSSGEIGLVVYGDDVSSVGTYGTLKRVQTEPGRMTLIPINSEYETVSITGDDLKSVQIQGRLVQILRSY